MKLLPDICKIQYGFAFNSGMFTEKEGVPLVRIRDVVRGYSETYTTEECSEDYVVSNGDMLIGMDGEFNIAKWNGGRAWLNQRVCKLIPSEQVDAGYLFYFMPSALKSIEEKTPFVTVKHLSAKELNKIEVPMPTISVQKEIASILDKITSVIAHRKQQLAEFDKFIRARFVEMFGDPVENPLRWKKDILKNLTTKIGSGATPRGGNESYKETGISFIRSMNIYNNYFAYKELAHIDEKQADKLCNVIVEKDDVLLNITGASVARCCIVPEKILPARVNQHVTIVRCKRNILPIYISSLLVNDNYQKLLWNVATSGGATREALTKQQVENLEIITPPIELQNQFADFVQIVDKLRVVGE